MGSLGLTPFAKSDARSNMIIAVNYLQGMDDKKFRGLLSNEFKVLVAGGFGDLKGKVFRIGSIGEVGRYHVMRTISSISSAMNMLGMKTNAEAASVAMDRLKALS